MMEDTLKSKFDQGVAARSHLESRWEDYAGWTLPYVFPRLEYGSIPEMQNDYQALGAQAVNHLANKIVMTLFAPNRPFFKLELSQGMVASLEAMGFSQGDMEVFTGRAEREAMKNMERVRLRTSVIQAIKNLIITGNTLIFFPSGQPSQVYSLRDYVVKRDMSGSVTEIITRDTLCVTNLPDNLNMAARGKGYKENEELSVYTGVKRTSTDRFEVYQELEDICKVEGSDGSYPARDLPWLALTWNQIRGQNYGNGLVEEYAGDFSVYSSLSEANLNIASIAADIKILVNPMGQTDVDTLNNSEPGTYVYGVPGDVAYLQLEKLAELSFVDKVMDSYQRRLASGFLLNSQVTRDAERVTAEEIRLQANELESSLGGVYSRLAEEMQQPLARRLIQEVNPELAAIQPIILTGVESLNRNSEHEQVMLFLNDLTMLQNIPEQMMAYLKFNDVAKVIAVNRGIEYTKLLKTDEEVAAEQQAAQEAQAQQAMSEAIAGGMGDQMGNMIG